MMFSLCLLLPMHPGSLQYMQVVCQKTLFLLFQSVEKTGGTFLKFSANLIGKMFLAVANAFGLSNTSKAFSSLQYLLQNWELMRKGIIGMFLAK
ncbi:hypothetical protein [Mailhella sp.]